MGYKRIVQAVFWGGALPEFIVHEFWRSGLLTLSRISGLAYFTDVRHYLIWLY